ncbi:TolC family protein [Polynucleobacter sp. JS-Safj-400b-B2]|uniref:TolC family protein n=1 Tax=Polynucleobacter sp. JS-Safj-400b-B2 TaxID=2576921 RepID=UPI001C0D39FD|nr:TolC family protein [Polynucleobacter sp. JS-Safj-400b-B2]MBU3625348.1 TolC family protein [Polynucleobacter sp. JS-Safj-400b-B2]
MSPKVFATTKFISAYVICAALNGCMMYGDGTPPQVTLPDQWPASQNVSKEQSLPLYPWWQQLKSDELNELVSESLKNNRQVLQSINNIEQAQAQLDTIKLGWLPSLNFFGGSINGNTTLFFQGLSVPVANIGGFVGFLPTYVVNLLQQPARQNQAGQILEASQADYLAVRTAMIAQVTTAYVAVLVTERQTQILRDMQESLKKRAQITSSLSARGLGTQYGQNQLELELNAISGQLAQNYANHQAAQNALLILVGRGIGRIKTKQSLDQINTDVPSPGNMPASVVSTRPDVAAARARLDATNYGVTATASSLFPSISLNALVTNIKTTQNGSNASSNANFQAAYAALVLDPKIIGAISSSNAVYRSAAIAYIDIVNSALRETDDALSAYDAQRVKLWHDTEAFVKAKNNLKISESMYRQGLLSESQFLENKAQYNLVDAAVTQTKLTELIAMAKLYQSMGGGSIYEEQNLEISNGTVRPTQK